MLTGEKRGLSATRRGGMTVLGKVAVPKPINLPSQRLENRGLDPNVEIVPKGTLGWNTAGRSPPTTGGAWGATYSSSPPTTVGAWNRTTRPTSGGTGTRPSTAGSDQSHEPSTPNAWCSTSSRPSSASGVLGQSQSQSLANRPCSAEARPGSSQLSRFADSTVEFDGAWGSSISTHKPGGNSNQSQLNFTSVDFPTLGSEKISELPQQRGNVTSVQPSTDSPEPEFKDIGVVSSTQLSDVTSKETGVQHPRKAPDTWKRDNLSHTIDHLHQEEGVQRPPSTSHLPADAWHSEDDYGCRAAYGQKPRDNDWQPNRPIGPFAIPPVAHVRPPFNPSGYMGPPMECRPGAYGHGPTGPNGFNRHGETYGPYMPQSIVPNRPGFSVGPRMYANQVPYDGYFGAQGVTGHSYGRAVDERETALRTHGNANTYGGYPQQVRPFDGAKFHPRGPAPMVHQYPHHSVSRDKNEIAGPEGKDKPYPGESDVWPQKDVDCYNEHRHMAYSQDLKINRNSNFGKPFDKSKNEVFSRNKGNWGTNNGHDQVQASMNLPDRDVAPKTFKPEYGQYDSNKTESDYSVPTPFQESRSRDTKTNQFEAQNESEYSRKSRRVDSQTHLKQETQAVYASRSTSNQVMMDGKQSGDRFVSAHKDDTKERNCDRYEKSEIQLQSRKVELGLADIGGNLHSISQSGTQRDLSSAMPNSCVSGTAMVSNALHPDFKAREKVHLLKRTVAVEENATADQPKSKDQYIEGKRNEGKDPVLRQPGILVQDSLEKPLNAYSNDSKPPQQGTNGHNSESLDGKQSADQKDSCSLTLDYEAQRILLKEQAAQRIKQRQKEEEERTKERLDKAHAKLEELERRSLVTATPQKTENSNCSNENKNKERLDKSHAKLEELERRSLVTATPQKAENSNCSNENKNVSGARVSQLPICADERKPEKSNFPDSNCTEQRKAKDDQKPPTSSTDQVNVNQPNQTTDVQISSGGLSQRNMKSDTTGDLGHHFEKNKKDTLEYKVSKGVQSSSKKLDGNGISVENKFEYRVSRGGHSSSKKLDDGCISMEKEAQQNNSTSKHSEPSRESVKKFISLEDQNAGLKNITVIVPEVSKNVESQPNHGHTKHNRPRQRSKITVAEQRSAAELTERNKQVSESIIGDAIFSTAANDTHCSSGGNTSEKNQTNHPEDSGTNIGHNIPVVKKRKNSRNMKGKHRLDKSAEGSVFTSEESKSLSLVDLQESPNEAPGKLKKASMHSYTSNQKEEQSNPQTSCRNSDAIGNNVPVSDKLSLHPRDDKQFGRGQSVKQQFPKRMLRGTQDSRQPEKSQTVWVRAATQSAHTADNHAEQSSTKVQISATASNVIPKNSAVSGNVDSEISTIVGNVVSVPVKNRRAEIERYVPKPAVAKEQAQIQEKHQPIIGSTTGQDKPIVQENNKNTANVDMSVHVPSSTEGKGRILGNKQSKQSVSWRQRDSREVGEGSSLSHANQSTEVDVSSLNKKDDPSSMAVNEETKHIQPSNGVSDRSFDGSRKHITKQVDSRTKEQDTSGNGVDQQNQIAQQEGLQVSTALKEHGFHQPSKREQIVHDRFYQANRSRSKPNKIAFRPVNYDGTSQSSRMEEKNNEEDRNNMNKQQDPQQPQKNQDDSETPKPPQQKEIPIYQIEVGQIKLGSHDLLSDSPDLLTSVKQHNIENKSSGVKYISPKIEHKNEGVTHAELPVNFSQSNSTPKNSGANLNEKHLTGKIFNSHHHRHPKATQGHWQQTAKTQNGGSAQIDNGNEEHLPPSKHVVDANKVQRHDLGKRPIPVSSQKKHNSQGSLQGTNSQDFQDRSKFKYNAFAGDNVRNESRHAVQAYDESGWNDDNSVNYYRDRDNYRDRDQGHSRRGRFGGRNRGSFAPRGNEMGNRTENPSRQRMVVDATRGSFGYQESG